MKTYSKYIALAAVAVSFAACQQEEMDITSQDDLVRIEATIGNLPQTRVEHTGDNGATSFSPGDKIYVVNTLRKGMGKEEATYEYNEGTWDIYDESLLVWNSGENIFQAWHPVVEGASYTTFTLPTNQSEGVACADWMTATASYEVKPSDNTLSLYFEHQLAKVTVNLAFATQYPEGEQAVSKFKFYTNEETQTAVTPCQNGTSYTAILLPGEYADGANFITLKMNDTDEFTVLAKTTLSEATEKSAINLVKGKQYTFNLTVGKALVEVSSVSVTAWNPKTINAPDAEGE